MRRSFWTLLVGCLLAGCAAPNAVLDRDALQGELASAMDANWMDEPQETPATATASGRRTGSGRPVPSTTESADDPPGAAQEEDEPVWRRADEAVEIAIIRDQLRRDPRWKEKRRARRAGITVFTQLSFVDGTKAVDGSSSDPDWDDLVDPGYGIGLEFSYEVLPVLQPLVGVKFNQFQGDKHHIGGVGGEPLILRDSQDVTIAPAYVGLRLNFPLALALEDWFDAESAGRVEGVVPFVRGTAGVAWVCGQEITLTDQTNNLTTRSDFLRRGWTGYFEAGFGVEYRVRNGFAFELSVGMEHYQDMKIDRQFKNTFPGADSEPLTIFYLPRLSATFYF